MLVLPVYGRRMTGRRSFPEESAVGVGGFVREDTPTAEVDRREAVMASLTGTVRELIDALEDNWSKWITREGIKNLPETPDPS